MPGRSWPPGEAGEHGNLHIALCIKNEERPALVVPGKPWLALDPVPGHRLVARIQLTGAAAESALTWSAESAAAECG